LRPRQIGDALAVCCPPGFKGGADGGFLGLQAGVALDGRLELGLGSEGGFEVVVGAIPLDEDVQRVQAVGVEQGFLARNRPANPPVIP